MNRTQQISDGRHRAIGVELAPQRGAWCMLAAGAIVPLGMATAAACVTRSEETSERVAITAWIAVAIVGTAAMVSAGAAARRRTRSAQWDGARDKKRLTPDS